MADFEGQQPITEAALAPVFAEADSAPIQEIVFTAPVIAETTKPVVGNYSPAPGSTLQSTDSVSFDVTDNLGNFRRILVVVVLAGTGVHEVVHDGDGFVGFYAGTSGRALIANGFRYTVRRQGGWGSAPSFRVFAIDTDGNEAN